ncbi:hypothetical protein OPV22_026820 [Ensete ventricosum]|uniref:CLAVATA3/ESR-related protein n=1 Tax=Ensete ventricosum TaxID=4639 RepID=A0AAV8Q3M2_ENSVE|nr:hypothetical protein OPV22_026820 [Ensete ventricosum]
MFSSLPPRAMACYYCSPLCTFLLVAIFLFASTSHEASWAGSPDGQIAGSQPPRQPPPPLGEEIDPRYGVQKRLVPTGPNPLHN